MKLTVVSFTLKCASPEQAHDLANFSHRNFVKHISLVSRDQSEKKHLKTFSEKRTTMCRVNKLEKDKKLILECIRKRIKWSKKTGRAIEWPGEQLIELPLALSDNQGNPRKGQKSYMAKVL